MTILRNLKQIHIGEKNINVQNLESVSIREEVLGYSKESMWGETR